MSPPLTLALTLTFLSFISTNIFLSEAASSNNQTYNNFLECLTDQFQRSNSSTNTIFTPQNATYASLLPSQNLRQTSALPEKPDLIVTPLRVSDIQGAIRCSRILGLQIKVKSGGHDYEGLSYASASAPFVIVDMINFQSVTIDEKAKTARVQAGATIGQLYYAISRTSRTLAFPAGVCPTVGVGGHFSGGGYGMMSRKHSLAADHIVDALLINADGEVLDRKTMGEDLFWAIRGGGGTSFGIILEFTVTLVSVPETITIFNVTRTLEENATELVDRWQHIADKIDDNLLIRLFVNPTNSPTTGNRTIAASFTSLYLGRARDLLPAMGGQFPELGLTEQDCVEMSWAESLLFFANIDNQTLDVLSDRPVQGGPGSYFKGKSDFVSNPIPVSGLREMWRFLLEGRVGVDIEMSPLGGALSTYSDEEMPFPHRKGNLFMIHYGVGWAFANEAEGRLGWIRGLYAYMARHVTRNPRGAYVNYRDLDLGRNDEGNTSFIQARVWGERYFKSNFRKLVSVKTRVDPSNFFRNEQSIPPLVA